MIRFRLSAALILWPVLCLPAGAADAPAELLRRLGAQRPDVTRWETRAVNDSAAAPEVAVVDVGRAAARVPARFADGRVRWYAVAGFRPVAVVRHALQAGDVIDASSVEQAERDVIGSGCLPVALEGAARWRTTRRLSTGEPLCANSLERMPEVARDGVVTLSTQRAGIEVSRQLIACNDAHAGERVRLRDRTTGDTVIAIVTGPAMARVPE